MLVAFFQSTDIVAISVSFLSLIGVVFTAWMAHRTNKGTQEINRAVNHAPADGMRLYELVLESHSGLIRMDQRVDRLESDVSQLKDRLTTKDFL